MKKDYKKPVLVIEEFAFDSIMTGTGEAVESDIAPYVNAISDETGGEINLGDNNKLESINYKNFTLESN